MLVFTFYIDLDSPAIGSAQQIPGILRIDFFTQATGTFSSDILHSFFCALYL